MVSKLAIAFDQLTIPSKRESSASAISELVGDLQRSQRDVAHLTQINAYQRQIMASQQNLILLQTRQIADLQGIIQRSSAAGKHMMWTQ